MSNPYILNVEDVAVDVSMLYEVAGDDTDCIVAMVDTFLKTVPVTLNKMEVCLKEKDYEGLYKLAHYSKSSLSVIKITDAFETAHRIEKQARTQTETNELPAMFESLKRKVKLAEKALLNKFGAVV